MSKLFFRPAGRADVTRDAEDREKWYRDAAAPAEEVLARYGSSERGLDGAAADRSRETWGTNVLTYGRKDSVLKRLCAAFLNPFTVVLLALAGVSVFTDLVFAAPEDRSWATVVIITAMVALSGALRFVQETRSGNVADKHTGMLHTTATVLRDGAERELPLEEVAVGDVIRLSAGDMLPADVRILTAKDLFVSQSALTGESEPVEKLAEPAAGREALTDLRDLAFLGSSFTLILYLYSMDLSANQLISSAYFSVELISSLSSSIGVILSIPITALISAGAFAAGAGKKRD